MKNKSKVSDDEYEEESEEESEEEEGPEEIYGNGKDARKFDDKVKLFLKCIEEEGNVKGEWGFRSLKRLVKMYFEKKDLESVKKYFAKLLTYLKTNRNIAERKLNSLFDLIGQSEENQALYQKLLEDAIAALKSANLERIWFKMRIRLANLQLSQAGFKEVNANYVKKTRTQKEKQVSTEYLRKAETNCLELLETCKDQTTGLDDSNKSSQLMEALGTLMQVYVMQEDIQRQKEIYSRAMGIRNAMVHPRISGLIRLRGGIVHMYENDFEAANVDFSGAFKHYEEAGSNLRVHCLKYQILASMLTNALINPMSSADHRVYRETSKEIRLLADLIEAYMNKNLPAFEAIIDNKENTDLLFSDPLVEDFMGVVVRNNKINKLKVILGPFTSVTLEYLSRQLHSPIPDVINLLSLLIVDGIIDARIDQVKEVVYINSKSNAALLMGKRIAAALENSNLSNVAKGIIRKYQDLDVLQRRYTDLQQWAQELSNRTNVLGLRQDRITGF